MSTKFPPELAVLMHGRQIGTLQRRGRTQPLQLRYLDDLPLETTPLSVIMPTAKTSHKGPQIRYWLAGLLPDRDIVLAAWRRTFQVASLEEYALLPHIGLDLAGAAQFCPLEVATEPHQGGTLLPLSDEEVGQRLDELRSVTSGWGVRVGSGRFSLAGAQAKLALRFDGRTWFLPTGGQATTHILKPAITDLPEQDLNEHLTMRTAAQLGLPVPPSRVMTFAGHRSLVVQRYDRGTQDGQVFRVHQEDLVQALGRRPADKYEVDGGPSVMALVDLLQKVVSAEHVNRDVRTLLEAIAFNWLVAGTDGHAKNYSLLLSGNQVRMAPLYDLNSFLPYNSRTWANLSMAIGGDQRFRSDQVTAADWQRVARRSKLDPDELLGRVVALATDLPAAAAQAVARMPTEIDEMTSSTRAFGSRFVDAIAEHAGRCLKQLWP